MRYILETDRLLLRELTLNDAPFVVTLLNSPGYLKFIGNKNVRTEEQAKHYLTNGPIKSYSGNGYGLFLVEEKTDHQAIGMCGIINRDGLDSPDIGFAFLPDYTNYGYAFESASAILNYAKNQLNIPEILAIVLPDNARSIRLLEKIGLKFIKTFSFPNNAEELLLFSNQPAVTTN
jgi:RimJ/RimL family protein N-acetyltransferase